MAASRQWLTSAELEAALGTQKGFDAAKIVDAIDYVSGEINGVLQELGISPTAIVSPAYGDDEARLQRLAIRGGKTHYVHSTTGSLRGVTVDADAFAEGLRQLQENPGVLSIYSGTVGVATARTHTTDMAQSRIDVGTGRMIDPSCNPRQYGVW